MEQEGLLPCSAEPAICSCPVPDEPSLRDPVLFH